MLNKVLQSSQESCDPLAVPRKVIRCDECGSEHAALCSVELRFFCTNHFVAYCYQRLAESEKALSGSQCSDSPRRFLQECAAQAVKLLLIGQELENIDRARLFDIMLWANQLFYRSISKSQNGREQAVSGCR
jgi:hypothetical protein